MMIRLHPLQDLGMFSRQLDRVFEEIGSLDRHPKSVKSDWQPRAELIDSPDNLTLRVYLPGVDVNELDIEATKESIVISGNRPYQKPTEDRHYYWSEFNYGKFRRTFSLPVPVAHDRVQADYRDGILKISLPKEVAANKKTVKVQLGGQAQAEPTVAPENSVSDQTTPIAA